jgi:hypothetical protein
MVERLAREVETADQRTSTFSRRDYYNTSTYRTFLFSVRTSF